MAILVGDGVIGVDDSSSGAIVLLWFTACWAIELRLSCSTLLSVSIALVSIFSPVIASAKLVCVSNNCCLKLDISVCRASIRELSLLKSIYSPLVLTNYSCVFISP